MLILEQEYNSIDVSRKLYSKPYDSPCYVDVPGSGVQWNTFAV